MSVSPSNCPLCRASDLRPVADSPGYQAGIRYQIYECASCRASFAHPLEVSDAIYSRVYSAVDEVPGYNRYAFYAREVLRRRQPLTYLERQEESYWAVGQHLRRRRRQGSPLRVLEVGCGMGYLTYALVREGFSVLGTDISAEALAWATKNYGPHYARRSLEELLASAERYDVIVANQLIEHVPDVEGLVRQLVDLLAEGGELLLTTPNKDVYPEAEWETDLPPIHLWWFGEAALTTLGQRCGCAVSFVDWSSFYAAHVRRRGNVTPLRERTSLFGEDGVLRTPQPIAPWSRWRRVLEETGGADALRALRAKLDRGPRWRDARGPILAAIFSRGGTPRVSV